MRYNNYLMLAGLVLLFSGLCHLGIWYATGSPWVGDVSWRKPALFGISGGLTLVSVGMLVPMLVAKRRDGWTLPALAGTMLIEVFLITFQQWRSVPSHFNHSTPFDSAVEVAISLLILMVAIILADLSVRTFTASRLSDDYKVAWQGGMTYMMLSCLIGVAILVYGLVRARNGQDPTVFGESGVVKFPHGMTIHALQLLPILCWWLVKLRTSERQRVQLLRHVNVALGLLLVFSLFQTLMGRSRSDLSVISVTLLILVALFALPLAKTHIDFIKDILLDERRRRLGTSQ